MPISISVWCFSQTISVCVCEYRKSSLENGFVCSILHVCSPLPLRILNELTYIAHFQLKVTESVAWQEVRGREEKIRPRRKAERQRGREVVDGTPGLLDTLAVLRSLCTWLLGGPGRGPLIFVGLGLAPLCPEGGSGSTVPASLHLTEGGAHPLQPGPGSGRRGQEMPPVVQGSLSGILTFHFPC